MKLSACFVVGKSVITEMKKLNKVDRIDYILGIGNNDFEMNMTDMNDYTETHSDFYNYIQQQLLYPIELNLNYLKNDCGTTLYILDVQEIMGLYDKIKKQFSFPISTNTGNGELTYQDYFDCFCRLIETASRRKEYCIFYFEESLISM